MISHVSPRNISGHQQYFPLKFGSLTFINFEKMKKRLGKSYVCQPCLFLPWLASESVIAVNRPTLNGWQFGYDALREGFIQH